MAGLTAARCSTRRAGRLSLALALFAGACGDDGSRTEPEDRASADANVDTGSVRGEGDAGTEDAGRTSPLDAGARADANVAEPVRDAASASDGARPPDDAGRVSSEAGSARCTAPAVCSDFEADTAGALPNGFRAVAPNCSGDGKAVIDDSVAHSGKKSLRVTSGGGTCNHVFATPTLDFAALGSAFWVRFHVRFETPLSPAHVTFLAMQDQVSKKALRMGGQNKILMWNRESDDATLPELSPVGVSMSVAPSEAQFHCIEFQLDGAAGTLSTYVDGTLVPGLVIDGTPSQDIDGQWLRSGKWSAKVSELGFGWESYGGEPMRLWFDDIAISVERPGC